MGGLDVACDLHRDEICLQVAITRSASTLIRLVHFFRVLSSVYFRAALFWSSSCLCHTVLEQLPIGKFIQPCTILPMGAR